MGTYAGGTVIDKQLLCSSCLSAWMSPGKGEVSGYFLRMHGVLERHLTALKGLRWGKTESFTTESEDSRR